MTDSDRDPSGAGGAFDPVSDSNGNLRRAFEVLAEESPSGETRQFGSVTTAATGVPTPFFNRVFVFEAPAGDLSAAIEWMSDRDAPFRVFVADPAVETVENHRRGLDLVKTGEQPGMAMTPLDGVPPRDSVVEITEVTGPEEREEYSTVTGSAFGWPPEVVEPIDRAALAANGVRLFLGRVDGQTAACGLLVRTGDVAGVYSIAVMEEFRRQGIGEAMTWEVLRVGRDDGCQAGVLQSSEMGYPLYERMGFETVVTYHQFEPTG